MMVEIHWSKEFWKAWGILLTHEAKNNVYSLALLEAILVEDNTAIYVVSAI